MKSEVDEEEGRDVLKFLANDLRDEAQGKIEREKQKQIEEKYFNLVNKKEYLTLQEYVEGLEDEHGLELEDTKTFIDTMTQDLDVEINSSSKSFDPVPNPVMRALKQKARAQEDDEIVMSTATEIGNEELIRLQKNLYKESRKMCFIISEQYEIEGRVSAELTENKRKIELMRVLEADENEYDFSMMTDSKSTKDAVDRHTHGFFIYKFVTKSQEYKLFTTERIDSGSYKVKGTLYELSDFKELGENTGLSADTDMLFASSLEPAIKALEKDQLEKLVNDIDHEWLMERMLGDYRNPKWFEELLTSLLMVNEDFGYPSGLLWIAETGTGKSAVLESLIEAFDEQETFSGTASTVKGLTPSFSQEPPKEGYLLKRKRVACVDECFNLLSQASQQSNVSMKDAFRPLLDLIEHSNRTYSSGNGSIRGQMSSMMIGAGNDSYGIADMREAADNLDEAFLGRFLLYEQTDSHIDFVEERKYEIDETEASGPTFSETFISVMDYLREHVKVSIDSYRIKEIKEDLQDQVPSNFSSIYRARYDHHLKNMVAGHVKYRSIIEGELDFAVKDEDYEWAEEMMEMLINSWGDTELKEMSLDVRPYYLDELPRRVFEDVRQNFPIEREKLEKNAGTGIGYVIKRLKRLDLIYKKSGKFRPYFSKSKGERKFENVK